MKLWELKGSTESGQENSAHKALVINTMRMYAPILEFAEFYSMVGNADSPRLVSSATGGTSRAIDTNYGDNQVGEDFASVNLKIFGDKVQVDQAHVRRGEDLVSLRLREIESFAKNLGKNLQYALVNHAVATSALQCNGLLSQVTPAQTVSLSAAINTDALRKAFVYKLRGIMSDISGGAQFIMMPFGILNEISQLATEYVKYGPSQFGGLVPNIDGVPIVIAGRSADGTDVLPWSTGNNGKVIVGRFGEKSDITIATNVGLEIKDLGLVGVHWTTQVDLDLDIAVLDANSIRLIDSITFN